MKATLAIVLCAALAAGLWQRSELSRLADREALLRRELSAAYTPDADAEAAARPPSSAARQDDGASFDPAAFVEKLVALMARHSSGDTTPDEEETESLLDELAVASPRQLKGLVDRLRQSPLPDGLATSLFQLIAPRIAEHDPDCAAGLAWEAGEWPPLRNVLRSWISRDPGKAAAWLHENAVVHPETSSAKFRALKSQEMTALLLAARLAADPAGEGLNELVRLKGHPLDLSLGEIGGSLPPGELATVMRRVADHGGLSENDRIRMIGEILVQHPDPPAARQVLLDTRLTDEQLVAVAVTLIEAADPVGREASLEWATTLPEHQREELLRRLAVQEEP